MHYINLIAPVRYQLLRIKFPDANPRFYFKVSHCLRLTLTVYVTNFFMVIGFAFGAMFSFEALAGWISLLIAFKYQRTRNEKLSFTLAAVQTTGKD